MNVVFVDIFYLRKNFWLSIYLEGALGTVIDYIGPEKLYQGGVYTASKYN